LFLLIVLGGLPRGLVVLFTHNIAGTGWPDFGPWTRKGRDYSTG